MLYRVLLTFILVISHLGFESFAAPQVRKGRSQSLSIANSYLGIPYRADGAENILGLYTSFNKPELVFEEPGLNCSGFLLSVIRKIYKKAITIKMVERDRKLDSGEGSRLGHDWDYGLDFIWNLVDASSFKPSLILPKRGEGMQSRGFNLHKRAHWDDVLSQIKPGNLYLFTINKDTRRRGYQRIFYHVGLIVPETSKRAWFYHATKKSNVHRMDLKSEAGLERFFYQFAESEFGPKYIYILEIPEPRLASLNANFNAD
ncbi:MAG: hypothetical protein HRU09_03935 [Oligoflexales bacterium]|nr:hypothetical protein [Oligoflexales bacterium]